MKLEEGMYVRTKVGKIAKIINKYDNSGSLHNENFVWVLDDSSVLALHSQKAVKASYNLIDLIEKGDYVNGKRVYNISIVDGLKYLDVESEDYLADMPFINADQITSVVAKEQFESIKYEVKKDE